MDREDQVSWMVMAQISHTHITEAQRHKCADMHSIAMTGQIQAQIHTPCNTMFTITHTVNVGWIPTFSIGKHGSDTFTDHHDVPSLGSFYSILHHSKFCLELDCIIFQHLVSFHLLLSFLLLQQSAEYLISFRLLNVAPWNSWAQENSCQVGVTLLHYDEAPSKFQPYGTLNPCSDFTHKPHLPYYALQYLPVTACLHVIYYCT